VYRRSIDRAVRGVFTGCLKDFRFVAGIFSRHSNFSDSSRSRETVFRDELGEGRMEAGVNSERNEKCI